MLTNQDIEEISSDVFYAVWKSRDNLIQTEDYVLTEQVEAIRKLLKEYKYPDRDILIAYYFYEFKL